MEILDETRRCYPYIRKWIQYGEVSESRWMMKHPAFPSVVISNKSDAPGLEKAQHLGVPTEIIDRNYIKK